MSRVSSAIGTPYWELTFMQQAVKACHTLFNNVQPMWDDLYMLKVMSYRQLQRGYHINT